MPTSSRPSQSPPEARKTTLRRPILPRHGIYLFVGHSVAQYLADVYAKAPRKDHPPPGEPFAGMFRETWKRIPLADRRSLLRYWRSDPIGLRVELSEAELRDCGIAAACLHHGFTLRFRPYHDFVRGESTLNTIAHELAHAFQWAADPDGAQDYEAAEDFACVTADSWGFPQDFGHERKREWSKNHRKFVQLQQETGELLHQPARK